MGRLTNEALAGPIRLKPDRFEALVLAHEAFLAGRPGGRRATLKFIVATGLACERRILADARFDGADFSGSSFRGADLRRTSLYCANLTRCDFRGAKMQRADLRGATFAGASMAGANLDQADMRAAVLWASDEVLGLRWVGGRARTNGEDGAQTVAGVDFSHCSLQGAQLRDANLKNADFTGANLAGADLIGARLEGVRLKGAILSGVDVQKLKLPAAALAECVLDPTPEAVARVDHIRRELDRARDWISSGGSPAQLDGFDLRPAAGEFHGRLLAGLRARGAVAIGLDLSGSQLHGADFTGADLRGANFAGADLRGATFAGANLAHARFGNALIGELELRPGLSLPTRFDDAVADGADLPQAAAA